MRLILGVGLCLLAVCNPWAAGDEAGSLRPQTLNDVYMDCITDGLVPILLAHESGLGPVAEFGRMLDGRPTAGADALTVDSDLYWIAFFGVGWADPSIYLVRTCLLMSEGRLEHAANTLSFAVAPALMSDANGLASINMLWSDLMELFERYDAIWRQGVSRHDQGRFAEALEHYDRVLAENPTNCPALVSKGVTLAAMERKGLPGGSQKEALALWIDVGQKLAAGLRVEEEIRTMVRVLAEKGMNAASSFLSQVMKRPQTVRQRSWPEKTDKRRTRALMASPGSSAGKTFWPGSILSRTTSGGGPLQRLPRGTAVQTRNQLGRNATWWSPAKGRVHFRNTPQIQSAVAEMSDLRQGQQPGDRTLGPCATAYRSARSMCSLKNSSSRASARRKPSRARLWSSPW